MKHDTRAFNIIMVAIMAMVFIAAVAGVIANTAQINACLEKHGNPLTEGGRFKECKQ